MTNTSSTTIYLDATERTSLYLGDTPEANHLALRIQPGLYDSGSDLTLVFGHSTGHDVNAAFMRRLAAELLTLADRSDELAAAEMAEVNRQQFLKARRA